MQKNIFKISFLAIFSTLIASTSFASTWEYPGPEQYIDFTGGYGFSGISFYDTTDPDHPSKDVNTLTGYLSYGRKIDSITRVEFSLGYTSLPEKTYYYTVGTNSTTSKASRKTYSFFVNGYYNFFQRPKMDVYLMAGAGVIQSEITLQHHHSNGTIEKGTYDKIAGALQTGVGIAHNISKNSIVHLDYRISHDGASKYTSKVKGGGVDYTAKFKVKPTHGIMAGVSFKF